MAGTADRMKGGEQHGSFVPEVVNADERGITDAG